MDSEPAPRARRGLPRLHQWYGKVLYIIVGAVIYYAGGALASTDNARGILRSVLVLLMILLAGRVFRGATEPGNEPRPWWRMTGAPTAGFLLGVIFGLAAIGLLVYAIAVETDPVVHHFRSQEPYVVVTCLVFAALGVLYLTSSARLLDAARKARAAAPQVRASR
ncbi:MAG TPA: hypothetical protein VHX87_10370 [Galbitalea sp.]|jgi:uncharacterized membrane protein YfcA|nr:hypothetical protein [Galbitalea sp.]